MPNGDNILDMLDPAFIAQLSPEALKKLSEVRLTKEGGIPELLTRLILGRSGYSTLFNQIYLEPGVGQRTIQHEALHPLTRRPVIDLNPGAYFGLTPEQRQEMKDQYLGPDPSLLNKIQWGISGRFDETIPQQWTMAGEDKANLPPSIAESMKEFNIFKEVAPPTTTGPQSIDQLLAEQTGRRSTQRAAETADRVMLQNAKRMTLPQSFLFPAKESMTRVPRMRRATTTTGRRGGLQEF